MKIPKHLRHLLLKRGGMERITRELATRNSIVERDNVVFSTQQQHAVNRDAIKNKGTISCSIHAQTRDPFAHATSGRTRFWSVNDGTVLSDQAPCVRIFRERKGK